MEVGFVLEEVQVSPLFLCGVIRRSWGSTNRTDKGGTPLEIYGDVETVGFLGKGDFRYLPGRGYAKGHTKKHFRLHEETKPPGRM